MTVRNFSAVAIARAMRQMRLQVKIPRSTADPDQGYIWEIPGQTFPVLLRLAAISLLGVGSGSSQDGDTLAI